MPLGGKFRHCCNSFHFRISSCALSLHFPPLTTVYICHFSPTLDFLGLDLRIKSHSMDIDIARLLLPGFTGDSRLIN